MSTLPTIPNSVTSIGESAFKDCNGLRSVTILAETPPSIYESTFDDYDHTLYIPYGAAAAYLSAGYWSNFTNIVELYPTEITITIGQYGSGTYCSEFALDFSEVEGLKAYAATAYNVNTGIVTMTRVNTAAGGVGLFINGEPGSYVVPIIDESYDYSLNMLVGTLEKTAVNGTSDDGKYINLKYTIKTGE